MKERIMIFFIMMFSAFYLTASEHHDSQQMTSYEEFVYHNPYSGGNNNSNGNGSGGGSGSGSGSGSSGGQNNGNNGGGISGDPSGEAAYVQSLNSERTELTGELNAAKEAANSISTGEESADLNSGTGEIAAAVEQNSQKASEISDGIKEVSVNNGKNVSEVAKESEAKNSKTTGDPVKISKGSYEQNETDFVIGGDEQFPVNRHYDSQNSVTGSFGFGWTTNLDERIILGTDESWEMLYQKVNDYIKNLNLLIKQISYVAGASDKAISINDAMNDVQERISDCQRQYANAESLLKRIRTLKVKTDAKYVYTQEMETLEESCVSLMNQIEDKQNQLFNSLTKIKDRFEILNQLEKEKTIAKGMLEEIYYNYKENVLRIEKNKFASFPGTNKKYECTGKDTIVVIDEYGYAIVLYGDKDFWKSKERTTYSHCEKNNEEYILYEINGNVKTFDSNGLLRKIKFRNDNYIEINRDACGKIRFIKDSTQACYEVEYQNDFVSKITNIRAPEETVNYEYLDEKLISVTDSEGDTVRMEYDSYGQMTCLNKCDGSKVSFIYGEFDENQKRLITSTINEEGYAENFVYYKSQNRTDYIDHDGNTTSYFYDEKQRTIKEIHSDGRVIQNEYDDKDNLIWTNINGDVEQYFYDNHGNKIKTVYSDNTCESWIYDDYNLLIFHSDRDGLKEEFERDPYGNVIEYKKGGELVFSKVYDFKGRNVQQTIYGQNNLITDYIYDEAGNCIEERCAGLITRYNYDSQNRIIEIIRNGKFYCKYVYGKHEITKKFFNGLNIHCLTNGRKDVVALVQEDSITGEIHTVEIEYDKRHLPLRVFAGDNNSKRLLYSYLYTPEGKIRCEVIHGKESWVKVYDYKNNQVSQIRQFMTNFFTEELITEINESILLSLLQQAGENIYIKKCDVEEAKITYTPAGKISGIQSPYGGWYEYAYNSLGLMAKSREVGGVAAQTEYYPDGSVRYFINRLGKTTYYDYDNRGRIISVLNNNQKVWYEYDDFDRIIKKFIGNNPDEFNSDYYVKINYSTDGRNEIYIEGGKYKIINNLDAFGNVIEQTDGAGNTRRFLYDCQNHLIEEIDPYGNSIKYEYNAIGKISRQIDKSGAQRNYEYNYFGYLEKITDECGIVYSAKYDRKGQIIKEFIRPDKELVYEYDDAGRISAIKCGGEIMETYNYNLDGSKVTVTDGNGEKYFYDSDLFGRLLCERNRNGDEQKYFYDAEGELKRKQCFDGRDLNINISDIMLEKTILFSDGSSNHFLYDSTGNIIEARNSNDKTVYYYDKGGKLIYQKDDTTGEELFFEYDSVGNRTRIKSSNRDTVFTYGRNNEVKQIFDNKQRVSIELQYNKNGQEILRRFGNGTEEETHYDQAGRVILKTQQSANGTLLWAEGYVYGSDGKRIATADNSCRVTLYEYNSKGQLSTVYYPYSEQLINNLKNEAQENGLSVTSEIRENRFLSTEEKNALIPLLNSMQYGLGYNLSNLQIFIKESYKYDGNGNRISKENAYGSINYIYDKENYLLASGSNNQSFIKYTYDKMGNMLTEESSFKTVRYSYNQQNRLSNCEIIDRKEKIYSQTSYAYDSFGRRVIVQDKGEPSIKSIYDGFSFDVIKQGPAYIDALFTDGTPTGGRYRYLSDDKNTDDSRYYSFDNESYKNSVSRFKGERTTISVNGKLAAQASAEGVIYYATDLLRSVSSATDEYGLQKSLYSYDVFGSLVSGELSYQNDFGYLGKQQDSTSKLYNYGQRDYSSQLARFTTKDPIRDGFNWFSYCACDPVNFVDIDGLFYYSANGQESITNTKKTTVVIIRNNDGLGNSFDSTRYIYKNDGINTRLVYADTVGANCSKNNYKNGEGFTLPDGNYYLSNKGTSYAPLYNQSDGTTNSTSYKNVLSLRTNDSNLSAEERASINKGDNLMHANQKNGKNIYTDNQTSESAGCIIGKDGQSKQDKMMDALMDGVKNPEAITVKIRSFEHEKGCGK